jgi:predicted porin
MASILLVGRRFNKAPQLTQCPCRNAWARAATESQLKASRGILSAHDKLTTQYGNARIHQYATEQIDRSPLPFRRHFMKTLPAALSARSALLALSALASTTALAQTQVTVYGLLDTGIEFATNANPAHDRVLRLTSGGMNTSRLGFKGAEDLGGGLKALFQLESGLMLDTGAVDGALFKRQANVGLSGSFGRVVAGRSYDTSYDFMLPFDPMGYAPNYSWVTSGNGTAASKYGMPTAFDNIIKYQGQFGPVKIGASYGFGEQPGSFSDSAKYNAGLVYASGPFSVGATYDRVNGNTVAPGGGRKQTSTVHLAAAYSVTKDVSLKAGYRNYKQAAETALPDVRADLYWGGVNYQATPVLGLTGAVYYQDVKNVADGTDADPVMVVLRAKYALSKRTWLYAAGAYAKARNNQLVGLTRDSSADGGVSGFASNQTGLTLGIQHRF